jgi:hypothetical protein
MLFNFRSNEGFLSFFSKAAGYNPDYGAFAGASQVIPDDDSSVLPQDVGATTDKMREPPDSHEHAKMREPSLPVVTDEPNSHGTEIAREPTAPPDVIPFDKTDFDPIKDVPVNSEFTLEGHAKRHNSVDSQAYKRNQQRLLTVHKRLGHKSFARLRLLSNAGHIPKELANIDFPVCPGCAYGKAHRRPWRHKGSKNRKRLRVAYAPGDVVSIDQLVSPTEGFIPTHRGTPTTKQYTGATVFVCTMLLLGLRRLK